MSRSTAWVIGLVILMPLIGVPTVWGQLRSDDPPASLRLTAPTRMVNDKTWTCRAELLDASGDIDWSVWNTLGTVSAVRVGTGAPVPTTITVFETYAGGAGGGIPPPDSIRFYNGVGSVSITLDNGTAEPPGDIEVTVTVSGVSATTIVTVLDAAAPGLFQGLSGTVSGGNLIWEPADGVIHLTGNVTVPAGSTLTILPGTLVMVDSGPAGNGTKILASNASVAAQGTQADPIFFFPTSGPAGMTLPQTVQNNAASWGGIDLSSSGASTLSYVLLTGAGNGPVTGHPRPAVLRVTGSHSLTATDCVFADSPGKIVHGAGTGTYTFRRCLLSRNGIGGEFLTGGYTLVVEDTWFTRIGRAPEAYDVDGDILHVDYPSSTHLRRCVMTDGGDDVIDHSNAATPVLENCIIYDARDKVVSMGGGGTIALTNCLIFNVPNGIVCGGVPAYLTHCTLGSGTNVSGQNCGSSAIQSCILWTNSAPTCCGAVDYTLVGNPGHLGCGTGNFSANPLFADPANHDYRLQPGSPALTAGPTGGQIGWLGFPAAGACAADADCNDGLYCNGTETCVGGACQPGSDPCPGATCVESSDSCVECLNQADCDDGLYCDGAEQCVGGTCQAGTSPCAGQQCDEVSDACVECLNHADCDDANACTLDTCNPAAGCEHTTVSCDDSLACTDDSCDPATGCVYVSNCPQGESCNLQNGVCEAGPVTVIFQEGVDGYADTADTFLRQAAPTTSHGGLDWLEWDASEGSTGQETLGLIRFDHLFGVEPGQIPIGAQVHAGTLTLTVRDPGQAGVLHEVLVDWDENTTYASFGGDAGAQPDEFSAPLVTVPGTVGTQIVDVTASVQAWISNPAANRGWIIRHTGSDGVEVPSSEAANVDTRARLMIEYSPPRSPDGDLDSDGDVDLDDYIGFADCMSGPGVLLDPETVTPANCVRAFDFNLDGAVDLLDGRVFTIPRRPSAATKVGTSYLQHALPTAVVRRRRKDARKSRSSSGVRFYTRGAGSQGGATMTDRLTQ